MREYSVGLILLFTMSLMLATPTMAGDVPDSTAIKFVVGSPASSAQEGSGYSYWGAIPPPHDSVTVRIQDTPRPTWEKVIRTPWYLVSIPFRLGSRTLQGSIILADEYGLTRQIKRVIGPMEGPFGIKLRLKAGSLEGPAWGLDTVHHAFLGEGNEMRLQALRGADGVFKSTLGLQFGGDRHTGILFGAGISRKNDALYFGRGPETLPMNEATYTQRLAWVGGGIARELSGRTHLLGTLFYSTARAEGPHDEDDLSIPELFSRPPSGYGEKSAGIISGVQLLHDTTTDDGRPAAGEMVLVGLSHFHETGGEGDDFFTLQVDTEQFFDLPNSGQTLALRSYAHWMFSADVDSIPFQRLLTNEAPHLLRGYRNSRWRDRGLTALSIEYRWPFWVNKRPDKLGVDLFLFTDIGQVFSRLDEFTTDNLTRSWGGGFRLIGNGGFTGRFELARSEERTIWRLQFYQLFQYAKGGVLHGFSQSVLR